MLKLPLTPILLTTLIDLTTFGFLVGILALSLVSLAFVFFLTLKSRTSRHLQNFNALWTVRFLLVLFILLWSLNELIRSPLLRRRYLYPLFPSLTIPQQAGLCSLQVALSLGLFEPGFLVTLLFLVNVSVKKTTPSRSWALVFFCATCLPILTCQIVVLYVSSLELRLPEVFRRSSTTIHSGTGESGHDIVLCGYPLISTIIFGAFSAWYCLCFSLSCFKVVRLVINKGLRSRIYGLAIATMVSLPLQVLSLGLSSLWRPDQEAAFGAMTLLVLVFTSVLAAFGEGIVVIKPIIDSLVAGDELCQWLPGSRRWSSSSPDTPA